MIEQIVELFRSADESAWVESESGGYVCIDGHFDVAIIEDWLNEVKAQAWEEGLEEGFEANNSAGAGLYLKDWNPNPYRKVVR